MSEFVLLSPSFSQDGSIPGRYTCDGQNVSPALEWRGAPDGSAAFALIVDDPDARDFVHWVVYNLTGSASGSLSEAVAASPDAPPQGRNDFGRVGYGGPCPPSGTHRYRFTLYALSMPVQLAAAPTADELRRAIGGTVVAEAAFTARYSRRR